MAAATAAATVAATVADSGRSAARCRLSDRIRARPVRPRDAGGGEREKIPAAQAYPVCAADHPRLMTDQPRRSHGGGPMAQPFADAVFLSAFQRPRAADIFARYPDQKIKTYSRFSPRIGRKSAPGRTPVRSCAPATRRPPAGRAAPEHRRFNPVFSPDRAVLPSPGRNCCRQRIAPAPDPGRGLNPGLAAGRFAPDVAGQPGFTAGPAQCCRSGIVPVIFALLV